MTTLPTLEEICDDFADLEDGTERLEYLIELGKELPPFPESARIELNRVLGCQSNVWVVLNPATSRPDQLDFLADSDAPMVRGLVGILLAAYAGHSPQEILKLPVEKLFEQLKLRTFLSPMRSNGLHSMVKRIQSLAELASGVESAVPAGVGPVAEPAASRSVQNAAPPKELTADEIETLRHDFPILATKFDDGRSLVYLDNGASTQRPRHVIQAMNAADETYYSNVHRGGHTLAARTTEHYEAARESVRRFLNARRKHEIVFTSGTTAAINLVAHGWGDANVRAGDEILLSLMEHHSNIVPWQQLAERTGCRIRFAPITDSGELPLDEFCKLLTDRTRLVAITAVSNVLGTINPVAEITAAAHRAGAVVLIDAAQSAPHQTQDVQALNADFVAFSGHKMLGPSGIGVLYGKEHLLETMRPFHGGGSMIRRVTVDGYEPASLPAKFEAGTPPIVAAIGLGAAIEYLERIGLDRIHRHEQTLTRRAHELLRKIPGLRLLGPAPDRKGGIVTFTINGIHADDISKVLDSQGVAIRSGHHCAMPLHDRYQLAASSRASFYLYNTLAEVEQLAAAVRIAERMIPH